MESRLDGFSDCQSGRRSVCLATRYELVLFDCYLGGVLRTIWVFGYDNETRLLDEHACTTMQMSGGTYL
jgi:hypothetical protein